MVPDFPLEVVVSGTPVSFRASTRSITAWKEAVRAAAAPSLPEGHWLTEVPIALTLYYFPAEPMEGDIDNILKPVLDSFNNFIYLDDRQVERIVVQKFEPERIFPFANPSGVLAEAIAGRGPKLYIRISIDPFEDLD
jgi:crossover junction endodeoxyribonuclease RusA